MHDRARRQGTWLPIAQLTTVLGLVFALEHWGTALVVACSFTIALFAWGVLGTMWGAGGLAELPRILGRGLTVGLMAAALAGLATTIGIHSMLVAGVLAISHPQVRTKLGTLWAGLVTLPAGRRPETGDHRDLSDADLCAAWQSSHATLRSARTPPDMEAIVQLRQYYLDELQRRHPDGLAAWMASGAPADDNPHRFLTRSGRRESPEPGGP